MRGKFQPVHCLCSTVGFRSHPDWNMQTNVDFDHKKKRTGGTLSVTLGGDPENTGRQLLLSTSVDHKVKDLKNVEINYKMTAIAPILVRVPGTHFSLHFFGSRFPHYCFCSMNVM